MASTTLSIHDKKNINGIKNRLHPEIQKCIPDITKIRFIDYKPSFCGIDYMDGVKVEDVKHPLSFGIDAYGRAFLSIKYALPTGKKIVETLFQRFSRDIWTWVVGTAYLGILDKGGYFLQRSSFFGSQTDKKTLALIKEICDNDYVYNTPSEEAEAEAEAEELDILTIE